MLVNQQLGLAPIIGGAFGAIGIGITAYPPTRKYPFCPLHHLLVTTAFFSCVVLTKISSRLSAPSDDRCTGSKSRHKRESKSDRYHWCSAMKSNPDFHHNKSPKNLDLQQSAQFRAMRRRENATLSVPLVLCEKKYYPIEIAIAPRSLCP